MSIRKASSALTRVSTQTPGADARGRFRLELQIWMYGWAIRNRHTSTDEDHKASQSWRQADYDTFPKVKLSLTPRLAGLMRMISGEGYQDKPANHHPGSNQFLGHRQSINDLFSQKACFPHQQHRGQKYE